MHSVLYFYYAKFDGVDGLTEWFSNNIMLIYSQRRPYIRVQDHILYVNLYRKYKNKFIIQLATTLSMPVRWQYNAETGQLLYNKLIFGVSPIMRNKGHKKIIRFIH